MSTTAIRAVTVNMITSGTAGYSANPTIPATHQTRPKHAMTNLARSALCVPGLVPTAHRDRDTAFTPLRHPERAARGAEPEIGHSISAVPGGALARLPERAGDRLRRSTAPRRRRRGKVSGSVNPAARLVFSAAVGGRHLASMPS
ncbi:hypothetical protein [Actinospica sp.]|uniref:hypothetical protein n=1 Tax=Actinospica sp. TaxID=1872142 RepID=UPI002CB78969|nr:hypothetical protein [Actinospica sp.]HWG27225.1 hypothetical protein [Actinospica sp.]